MISLLFIVGCIIFFFKQKTAYEMRISDWSSDVCSSDLLLPQHIAGSQHRPFLPEEGVPATRTEIRHAEFGKLLEPLQLRVKLDQIGRASCMERVCQYV